jgi:hypothetical protein
MIKQFKKIFVIPTNFEDQKTYDSKGYKNSAIFFLITALLLLFTTVRHWSVKAFTDERSLFYIIFLNILGFVISADLTYRFSKHVKFLKTFSDLKKIKLTFYFIFTVIIGVPYILMALWLFFEHDYLSTAALVLIFLAALFVIYFYDWRNFLKIQ